MYMKRLILTTFLLVACSSEEMYIDGGPEDDATMKPNPSSPFSQFAMPMPTRRFDDEQGQPTAIMPNGDSLTVGEFMVNQGGYRITLSTLLIAGGNSFNFVGSQSSGPSTLADKDNEGHNGRAIPYLTTNLPGWSRTNPWAVLIALPGMAQIAGNQSPAQAPTDLTAYLDVARAQNPGGRILLGKLSHIGTGAYSAFDVFIDPYNDQVALEAAARSSYVTLFDLSDIDPNVYTSDGVHYTAAGYEIVGTRIYNAGRGVVWK